jgi:hypothetical protein
MRNKPIQKHKLQQPLEGSAAALGEPFLLF